MDYFKLMVRINITTNLNSLKLLSLKFTQPSPFFSFAMNYTSKYFHFEMNWIDKGQFLFWNLLQIKDLLNHHLSCCHC